MGLLFGKIVLTLIDILVFLYFSADKFLRNEEAKKLFTKTGLTLNEFLNHVKVARVRVVLTAFVTRLRTLTLASFGVLFLCAFLSAHGLRINAPIVVFACVSFFGMFLSGLLHWCLAGGLERRRWVFGKEMLVLYFSPLLLFLAARAAGDEHLFQALTAQTRSMVGLFYVFDSFPALISSPFGLSLALSALLFALFGALAYVASGIMAAFGILAILVHQII